MTKEKIQIGLSRDLIIHPGETLEEYLEVNDMSQKELAIRCGVSEKHISTILSGHRNISVDFAKKLEYALGIDADFWIALQSNYDKELLEFEEANNISAEEIAVLEKIKDIKKEFIKSNLISSNLSVDEEILAFRHILNISNLLDIPKLSHIGAFRLQNNANVDPYTLFVWEKYCELIDKDVTNTNTLDISKLVSSLKKIKKVMFVNPCDIKEKLKTIFYDLGINFYLVKSYKGAPIQGYIRRNNNNGISLYMTIRNKFADIFWFSLFHEIGHIMNGDVKNSFIDFNDMPDIIEKRADLFAENALIDTKKYESFIKKGDYSIGAIQAFSNENDVKSFVCIGRMMNDNLIKWSQYSNYRERYDFIV